MENIDKIIKSYDRYLIRIASTLTINEEEKQDLIQCGRIAIWKAYQKYDKEQGEFHQYALVCIRGAMHNFLTDNSRTIKIPANKLNKEIKTISINKQNDEGNEMDVEDLIEDNEDDDTQLHFKTLLRHYLPMLKEQYQQIIMMRYTQDMTFQQISDELGISRQGINEQHAKAIKKLKELFNSKLQN